LESEFYQRVRDIVDDRIHGSTGITLNILTFLSEKLIYLEISQVRKVLDEVLRIVKKRFPIILPAILIYILITLNTCSESSMSIYL
jgi:hypothetical protein